MVKKPVKKTLQYLNSKPLPTGVYPVVFENLAAVDLLSTFCSIFSAENAEKGTSLLKGKENTQVASELVTLVDTAFHEKSGLKCPFDDQGVPVLNKNIIDKGVLTGLLNNIKWANKTKTSPTGNGFKGGYSSPVSISPCNFFISPGTLNLQSLFEKAQNSVFITSLGGLHAGANTATGDFSLEAKGFLLENGKTTTPLKAFTVSGNFYQLLKDIIGVGSDLAFDVPGSHSAFGSPSLLVKNLSLAGQ